MQIAGLMVDTPDYEQPRRKSNGTLTAPVLPVM